MQKKSMKKIEANRINGKMGGVKSAEGKEIIRFNARKHGILANLISNYEKDIYRYYLDQLFIEFDPQGFIEEILVERIAIHYLRLFRLSKAENELMKTALDPEIGMNIEIGIIKEGYKSVVGPEIVNNLGNIYFRYEKSIENRLYKSIHELERLQRIRKGEKISAPIVGDMNIHT